MKNQPPLSSLVHRIANRLLRRRHRAASTPLSPAAARWRERVDEHDSRLLGVGGEYRQFELLRDHVVAGMPGHRAKVIPFVLFPVLARARRIVELGCSFSYYPDTYPDGSPWRATTSDSEGLVSTRLFLIACRLLRQIGVSATLTSVDIRDISSKAHAGLYENARRLLTDLGLIESWRPVMSTDSITWLKEQTEPIDVALVDSHHTYKQVKGELNGLKPLMSNDGLIIVDDCYNLDYQTGVSFAEDETPEGIARGGEYGAVLEFLSENADWRPEWVPSTIASVVYLFRKGSAG